MLPGHSEGSAFHLFESRSWKLSFLQSGRPSPLSKVAVCSIPLESQLGQNLLALSSHLQSGLSGATSLELWNRRILTME